MEKTCVTCQKVLSGRPVVHIGNAELYSCGSCDSWTYTPRVAPQEQAARHDNEDYYEHPYFQGRRAVADVDDRCRTVFQGIGRGMDLSSLRGEQVLDVGCDTGLFIASAARQFGVVPVGVDVASRAVKTARTNGVEAYHTDLKNAPAHLSDFSLITAVDLIEHVMDPGSFLVQVQERLRPGGCFYLETPNIRSIVYKLGAVLCRYTNARPLSLFERLFPAQHVQYFTPEALAELAKRHGFEVAWLGLRVLSYRDLHTSLPVRLVLTAVQQLDRIRGTEILTCALLRKGEAQ